MTIQQLLEKARENGKKRNYEDYLEICDGDIEETKEWIEHEKANGCYQRDEEHAIINSIFDLIKTIKRTSLMTEEEKKLAIEEIHKCEEYQRLEKKTAMMFANHFYKYKDIYLK